MSVRPHAHANRHGRFAFYAWFVLTYNLLTILWGAVVRATGSGAGCGEHWPLCQGVVIPHGAAIATVIEFAHRATSGVAVALVIGLVYFGFRGYARGHAVRRFALASLVFTLTEGLIGAALVLFGWTGANASPARFVALAVHLANTFLLLASLALTARASSAPDQPSDLPGDGGAAGGPRRYALYGTALLGTLAVAITGTIAALADSLYPAGSLAQGLSWDFSAAPSPVLRLRIIHPILALVVGVLLAAIAAGALTSPRSSSARRLSRWLLGLVFLQFAVGGLNLVLLAPVAVQVLHLLVADLVWITLVLLAAELVPIAAIAAARTQSTSTAPPAAMTASAVSAWNRRP